MTTQSTLSVTLTNVTPSQFEAITKLMSSDTTPTTPKRSRKEPEETVSDEEEESFGKKGALKASDLEDEEDETDTDEDETDTDEGETSVTFQDVKGAMNRLGEKKPDLVRTILAAYGIKNPKELSAPKNERHYENIYRKLMVKIKAGKKSK